MKIKRSKNRNVEISRIEIADISHPRIAIGDMNTSEPFMEPYARHVLVCVGSFCSPDRRGRELYALLASLLEREGLLFGPQRVKRGETPCLGVCAGGPIALAMRSTRVRNSTSVARSIASAGIAAGPSSR